MQKMHDSVNGMASLINLGLFGINPLNNTGTLIQYSACNRAKTKRNYSELQQTTATYTNINPIFYLHYQKDNEGNHGLITIWLPSGDT